jgi:RNA polymerase sigma factor for flagellar operon FliA
MKLLLHICCGPCASGLIEALRNFDPSKNVKFSTYAFYRIKGAMLDSLRDLDWLPRPVRQKIQHLQSAETELRNKLGRDPLETEVAAHMHMNVEDVRSLLGQARQQEIVSLEEVLQENVSIDDGSEPTQDKKMAHEELVSILSEAIRSLDEKVQLVLSLYYYEGLHLKEIGKVLHLTESRISQLLTKGVSLLREKMEYIRSEI